MERAVYRVVFVCVYLCISMCACVRVRICVCASACVFASVCVVRVCHRDSDPLHKERRLSTVFRRIIYRYYIIKYITYLYTSEGQMQQIFFF